MCKSQRFRKSLETSASQTFFLRFLKSLGWYGFSYGFLAVLNLFHQWIILICTNIQLIKCCPPPPCTCTLCCDIMLVTDLPCSMVNCGHGPYSPPESRRKRQKKSKLGLKLQCTLYVYRNVHLRFFLNFYLRCSVLFCKIFWTLPGRHQPKVSTLSLPPPSPI